MSKPQNLLALFLILYLYDKTTNGNVIFRFGFDFGLDANETSFHSKLHIGEEPKGDSSGEAIENVTSEIFTTSSPLLTDIWSRQAQLNATAADKLQTSRQLIAQLRSELSVVVGRSDFIAAKVKLMTRYLHKADSAVADATATNRFIILQDFVQLVDDLRVPPGIEAGGERSLEYAVMKMALDKYKLVELQTQILVEVLQAMEVWQNYVQTQLVDVVTV